ncbi:MAG: hypothetical protein ACD_47C00725G0001 [uncultured bacterium]|nr:MAG: hypothetical protein ACD_47C00725G0001 [uncultured bacterium]
MEYLNLCSSIQRVYILISICAQSCDSVPPAPGWIEMMAEFASNFSSSSKEISNSDIFWADFFIVSKRSARSELSFSACIRSKVR